MDKQQQGKPVQQSAEEFDRWLTKQLQPTDDCLEDNGFTERVIGELPTSARRPWWPLALQLLAMLCSALPVVYFGLDDFTDQLGRILPLAFSVSSLQMVAIAMLIGSAALSFWWLTQEVD